MDRVIALALALALLVALVPCGIACARGSKVHRLVALELAGTILPLALILLHVGSERLHALDLALVAALLSLPSGLLYARFLERWL